jgi:predicted TIM-barrel fold metal-dependent hydrolase
LIDKRTNIIIPHLGFLNGGYDRLKAEGIFAEDNIYADSALADEYEIIDFTKNFGTSKLLFGSDYPFGSPYYELKKIEMLFSGDNFNKITCDNLLNLFSQSSY